MSIRHSDFSQSHCRRLPVVCYTLRTKFYPYISDYPVDKNRSTTGGRSGPSYLQLHELWPQQEDSPDHANWVLKTCYVIKSRIYKLLCQKLWTVDQSSWKIEVWRINRKTSPPFPSHVAGGLEPYIVTGLVVNSDKYEEEDVAVASFWCHGNMAFCGPMFHADSYLLWREDWHNPGAMVVFGDRDWRSRYT